MKSISVFGKIFIACAVALIVVAAFISYNEFVAKDVFFVTFH